MVAHVSEGELSLLDVFDHLLLLVLRNGFLHGFHKAGQITETQESLDEPAGLKGLEIFEMLSGTYEDHRTISGGDGAEGTTTLGMAV